MTDAWKERVYMFCFDVVILCLGRLFDYVSLSRLSNGYNKTRTSVLEIAQTHVLLVFINSRIAVIHNKPIPIEPSENRKIRFIKIKFTLINLKYRF